MNEQFIAALNVVYAIVEENHKSAQAVIRAFSEKTNTPEKALCGVSRKEPLVFYRQGICYVLREQLDLQYARIAELLGKDHSTIIHGVQVIEDGFHALHLAKPKQPDALLITRKVLAAKHNSVDDIVRDFSMRTHVPIPSLMGRSRRKPLVSYRQGIYYVARSSLPLSYPELGRQLHRDHATIIYGVNVMATALQQYGSATDMTL